MVIFHSYVSLPEGNYHLNLKKMKLKLTWNYNNTVDEEILHQLRTVVDSSILFGLKHHPNLVVQDFAGPSTVGR